MASVEGHGLGALPGPAIARHCCCLLVLLAAITGAEGVDYSGLKAEQLLASEIDSRGTVASLGPSSAYRAPSSDQGMDRSAGDRSPRPGVLEPAALVRRESDLVTTASTTPKATVRTTTRKPEPVVGPPGYQGREGERGTDGARGSRGRQGHKGRKGQQGPVGLAGQDGLAGPPGDPGPRGDKGKPGQAGDPGAAAPPVATKGYVKTSMFLICFALSLIMTGCVGALAHQQLLAEPVRQKTMEEPAYGAGGDDVAGGEQEYYDEGYNEGPQETPHKK